MCIRDSDSPEQARRVLDYTSADAVMIGRGAQGRPWIFREIAHFLASGERLVPPSPLQIGRWVTAHLTQLYEFYGETAGIRIARKHLIWYSQHWPKSARFRACLLYTSRCG